MKKYVFIALIISGFVLVRVIGKQWFYDPLISFFQIADYSVHSIPKVNIYQYILSITLRFWINTILTLVMVYVIFHKMELVKLTIFLFGSVWISLLPVLIWLIVKAEVGEYQFLVYVRRILIHPVLTLIYIPALLYNEHIINNDRE